MELRADLNGSTLIAVSPFNSLLRLARPTWRGGAAAAWKSQANSGSMLSMANSVNDNPQDPELRSMADILVNLPAIRAARKANTLSRIHRRLIEPIETDQDNETTPCVSATVFCQTACRTAIPATMCGCGRRTQGLSLLEVQAGRVLTLRHGIRLRLVSRGAPSRA